MHCHSVNGFSLNIFNNTHTHTHVQTMSLRKFRLCKSAPCANIFESRRHMKRHRLRVCVCVSSLVVFIGPTSNPILGGWRGGFARSHAHIRGRSFAFSAVENLLHCNYVTPERFSRPLATFTPSPPSSTTHLGQRYVRVNANKRARSKRGK